jgi:hypothetical protein
MHRTMPWHKTNTRNTAAVLIAPGLITSPPIVKHPITFALLEPPGGAACPATTDISTPRCPTPALTADDANMPTATI